MTMRRGLTKSKNMISIRILNKIGARYGQEYATRFGFDADKNPPYLTLALGAGADHAAADGRRLFGVRQRRLPRQALPDLEGRPMPTARCCRKRGRSAPASRPTA